MNRLASLFYIVSSLQLRNSYKYLDGGEQVQRILFLSLLMVMIWSQVACQTNDETNAREEAQTASRVAGEFSDREFRNERGERMRYRLFVPANYDATRSYPLTLWLHGSGARGDDLRLLAGADASGIDFLARPEHQAAHPSFIVAPQCPSGRRWDARGEDVMSNQMRLALEIVESVRANYNIDARRLYVMGISLGGHGVWDVIARRPEMFAAAIPICGRGDVTHAAQVARTPVWAFHGEADRVVPITTSREMIEAVRRAGGRPRYTEYEGVGHNSWDYAFREPELFSWMFAQRR